MPVEAIVRGVDLAADEPPGVRRVRPVQHLRPPLEPVERFRLLGPEGVRVLVGPGGQPVALGGVDVRLLDELRRRRELAGLLQDAGDIRRGHTGTRNADGTLGYRIWANGSEGRV